MIMSKTKVCMLTTGHSALDDRIFYKESRSLHRAGYDVYLIAPLNKDGFLTDMGGMPVAKQETIIDGIKIIGFKPGQHSIFGLPKTDTISQWLRLGTNRRLNFGQEPLSDIIEKGMKINADVYHCHGIWSLYTGIQIKRKLKKLGKNPKLVCDVHEFWSAKSSAGDVREILGSRVIAHFEKIAFKYTDYFITVNQIIRGYLLSHKPFIKVEILYNSPVLSIFKEFKRSSSNETIIICHEGALLFNRGMKEMLEVMKILKNKYNRRVKLTIIGDVFGEEKNYFDNKVKEYQIDDVVEKTGWLAYEKVGDAISNCNIGIIFMKPTGNNMFSSPNKLLNYMRYGLPIVTVDLPEIRRIIIESQCGVVVTERTVDAIVDALSMLIDDIDLRHRLGQNGKKAIMEKYHWGIMEKKLLRVYYEIINCPQFIKGGYNGKSTM